jgi:hypothetical protein
MASALEEEVKELCLLIAATTGDEQEAALAELRIALTALINEVENASKYKPLRFPSALEKRMRA